MNSFADLFLRETAFPCECGQTHHIRTKRTLLGKEVLPQIPSVIQEINLGKKALLVYDQNTYQAAGKMVEEILKESHYSVIPCLLTPQEESAYLEPDEEARSQVGSFLSYQPDFLLAVGSGVINDLTKFVAHRVNLPYAVVGTAPSMDGYPSPGAPMLVGGYKLTLDAQEPKAIFLDLDVLCQAPSLLIQAGWGDLVGKVTANSDWCLRQELLGEYRCEFSWKIVEKEIKSLSYQTEKIKEKAPSAIKVLAQALLVSGFSMSMVGDSRPASSAEHQIAHYLEMMALHRRVHPSLHGLRVGVATGLVQKIYGRFLEEMDHLPWSSSPKREPDLDQIKIHFGPLFPFLQKTVQKKMTLSQEIHLKMAQSQTRKALKQAITPKLLAIPQVTQALAQAGAPTTFEELGFSPTLIKDSLLFSRWVRDRYTIFDLLQEVGLLEEYVNWLLEE
ncbi:MAG: glycerol-phosphate dehydrogenase [Candidatus Atribacteria bacterium]|nr:glycerol-phosphate dehydrogenase [Candidatus Atribacteria bacterium]